MAARIRIVCKARPQPPDFPRVRVLASAEDAHVLVLSEDGKEHEITCCNFIVVARPGEPLMAVLRVPVDECDIEAMARVQKP